MSSMPVTTVDEVHGLLREDDKSSLTINYLSKGQPHAICFPRAVLADLLLGLAGMQSPKSGRPIDIPAILVSRVQPFQQDGGVNGLAFFLAGGWVLPFAIPRDAIPGLKATIADLELLSADTSGRQ